MKEAAKKDNEEEKVDETQFHPTNWLDYFKLAGTVISKIFWYFIKS